MTRGTAAVGRPGWAASAVCQLSTRGLGCGRGDHYSGMCTGSDRRPEVVPPGPSSRPIRLATVRAGPRLLRRRSRCGRAARGVRRNGSSYKRTTLCRGCSIAGRRQSCAPSRLRQGARSDRVAAAVGRPGRGPARRASLRVPAMGRPTRYPSSLSKPAAICPWFLSWPGGAGGSAPRVVSPVSTATATGSTTAIGQGEANALRSVEQVKK